MKLLKDKKGMTLVEIIVVLLIMSILLVIMGSLILNAFSYFNKTTDQDINKRSLDSISEYVRSELLYASDVRVQEEKPDDEEWNSLYIIDGKLYKNDETVYSEGFYNHNDLVIKLRGFEQYRLDLNYSFKDIDKANAYSTEDTLELLNLKIKIENENEFNPFSNISTVTTVSDKVKIYYQKSIKVTEEEIPIDPDEGTVADQIECLNFHNNRMDYNPEFGDAHVGKDNYRIGDMVFYNGYWWQLYSQIGVSESVYPGSYRHVWKKISAEFDKNSVYVKGDIVYKYNNDGTLTYYEAQGDLITWTAELTDTHWWKEVDKPKTNKLACSTTVTPAYQDEKGESVIYKILNFLEKNNLTLDDIPEFGKDGVNNHKAGSFVKVYDEQKGIYRYFLKLRNGQENNNKPGEKPGSNDKLIWQEMKIDWDEYSGYEIDDVVYRCKEGYYLALQGEEYYGSNINNINNSRYWEKLNKY